MEKVLVTGGAGYIGSALIPKLLENGNYKVSIIDNLTHNNPNGLLTQVQNYSLTQHPNFNQIILGDIRDIKENESIQRAFRENDTIIHLAALVGAPACKKNKELARSLNLEATLNLLEKASPLDQKFIFASTGSIYGKIDEVCSEDTTPNPISLYGQTKAEADKAVREWGGIAYRFATAFGVAPRLRLDLLPNDLTYTMVDKKSVDIFESHMRRTFIHVRDIADSFIFALKNYEEMKSEAYNIGGEEFNCTKGSLAEKIKGRINQKLGFEPTIYYVKDNNFTDPDQRDYEVGYKKVLNVGNGFKPKISFDEGIDELIGVSQFIKINNPYAN